MTRTPQQVELRTGGKTISGDLATVTGEKVASVDDLSVGDYVVFARENRTYPSTGQPVTRIDAEAGRVVIGTRYGGTSETTVRSDDGYEWVNESSKSQWAKRTLLVRVRSGDRDEDESAED